MAQQSKKGLGKANPVGYTNVSGVDVYAQAEPDLTPSDSQPPGVDKEPDSLEEALTGWVGREAPQSRTSLSLAFAL